MLKPPTPTTETTNQLTKVCGVWKVITYSAKADSAETVKQVRQNNAAERAYCGD